MKTALPWILAVAFAAGMVGVGVKYRTAAASAPVACFAKQNEMCPPADFVTGYREMKRENDSVYTPETLRKIDTLRGMADRLGSMIPQPACSQVMPGNCWRYDENLEKFVKVTPVAANAAPAPQPEAGKKP